VNGLRVNVVYLPGRESSEREGVSIGHVEGDAIKSEFRGKMIRGGMDSSEDEETEELLEALYIEM
jgi:hypothetical protein